MTMKRRRKNLTSGRAETFLWMSLVIFPFFFPSFWD